MNELLNEWIADPYVKKTLITIFLIFIVVVLVKASQRVLGRHIENPENRYRLRKLATLTGYIIAVFLLSMVFSDSLPGLTVFLGVAGAGVAFALQEVIASAAGWVTMSFGRFYNIGDRVQLGGIKGDVIDIGVLRTTLMECGGWINGDQYNGRIVRVANSFIFKEPVYNYSSDFPFLWDELTIRVTYGSHYEKAREHFQRVLDDVTGEHARRLKSEWRKMTDQYMLEDAQLEPTVTLCMQENWVEYSLRYVVDYKKRRSTKDKICMQILKAIEQCDSDIRLGASPFSVAEIPPLDIHVKNIDEPNRN